MAVVMALCMGCGGVGGTRFGSEVQPAGAESASVSELRDRAGGGSDEGVLLGDVGDKE